MSKVCGSGLHVHPACLQEGRELNAAHGLTAAPRNVGETPRWSWHRGDETPLRSRRGVSLKLRDKRKRHPDTHASRIQTKFPRSLPQGLCWNSNSRSRQAAASLRPLLPDPPLADQASTQVLWTPRCNRLKCLQRGSRLPTHTASQAPRQHITAQGTGTTHHIGFTCTPICHAAKATLTSPAPPGQWNCQTALELGTGLEVSIWTKWLVQREPDCPSVWSRGKPPRAGKWFIPLPAFSMGGWGLFSSIKKSFQGFPGGSVVKNLPANAGDMGSSPGPGRSHMPRSN
ncbi:uncharacterized protein LOC132372806 [Balaenoptera ricei]|uniref:uncharacterized protein LOC132372806 n=1 Tax=Balaenoptera ricei TaxID=2746895 RepID=UPI0028BD77B3|nr:uncharacterized protein LOC132372806 [Balaenoptera ricei]